jgi:hypothetical protein
LYRHPTHQDVAEILRLKRDKYRSGAISAKLNLDPRIVRRVTREATESEPAENAPVGAVEKLEQVVDRLSR